MVYVTSFTLTAVLVGSMLTLAVSNGIHNKFHFGSCSCQLYVNLSCELMCLHFFIQKYTYYVIVICPF